MAGLAVAAGLTAGPAASETLESALAKAYGGNPQLNASRANVRATDENVAIAKSGYRPTAAISADIGQSYLEGRVSGQQLAVTTTPGGAGLTVNQTLFNGFQTDNNTRRAESNVYSQRESLRSTEMSVLYGGVQSYM
ncbi:TolC family protein, partial [Methylobacterium sp. E-016]